MGTCGCAPSGTMALPTPRPSTRMSTRDVNLLFRAFSDGTRLRILHLVRGGEVCVGDLVKVLRVPQPTASRHLAYLRRAGLVVARKDGLWSYYSLAPARGRFHESLLACLESCFREVPELEGDARRFARVKKAGGCCP
jgi:ArsR family transcriptional regulator